jgi:hypothetical protein
LGTLLVYGEIHNGGDGRDDVETVFQPDFHVVGCSEFLHPLHVIDRVGAFEVQTVVVLLGSVSVAYPVIAPNSQRASRRYVRYLT